MLPSLSRSSEGRPLLSWRRLWCPWFWVGSVLLVDGSVLHETQAVLLCIIGVLVKQRFCTMWIT